MFGSFPSFESSDVVCVETDNASGFGASALGEGEEVGDGDGD